MRLLTGILAATSLALAPLAGCQSPPLTREELAALDYGPRPEGYEKIVRDYLRTRLVEPDFALVEFKAGPKPLYQKETVLRARQYGWAVCVMINDKDIRGAYGGFYPMVVYIRDGKVVAANGDGLERAAGVRYAHAQCRELGYEVPS
ncbi:MAG TPA: hypothetical protein VKC82_11615 [Burkholderiales bacterium]|nr:hypothetical protein [Burkholderiales bacterium]